MNKQDIMAAKNASLDNNLNVTYTANGLYAVGDKNIANALYQTPLTGWSYYTDYYYPYVVKESYPVYLQERAQDKGKQAFEIIKALQDKKLMKLEKVSDFIEAMDTLIKTL